MIQSTAPSLAVLSPAGSATAPTASGGDFAALLGAAPAGATVEAAALPMVVASPETPLFEAVKGVQDGLAALIRQAGVASQASAISLPVTPENPAISGRSATPPSATSPIALTAHLAVLGQPAEQGAPAASAVPMPVPAKAGEPALKAAPTPAKAAITADAPMPKADAEALPVVKSDGKNGKPSGKMLPETADARPAKSKGEAPSSNASQASTAQGGQPGDGAVTAKFGVELPVPAPIAGAALPLPEAVLVQRAASPAQDAAAAEASRPAAAAAIPAEVRAIRFEPIEIVRAPARPVRAATNPVTKALPVADVVLPVTPDRPAQPTLPQSDAKAFAPVVTAPVNTATAPTVAPSQSAQPDPMVAAPATPSVEPQVAARDPLARRTTGERQDTPAVPVPAAATTAPTAVAAATPTVPAMATPTVRPEHADAMPARITPEPSGETEARPAAEADKPAYRPIETAVHPTPGQPLTADLGSVSPDGPAAPAPAAPVETPHDFDTLLSRLADAREAASPHVVRTAFEHAEFGRVAMQLGQDENGLSVTLSSRDADFAPSVQAAAAAVVASGASSNAEQQHRDAPTSQQQNPNGQAQQARAEPSGQNASQNTGHNGSQQRREGHASRQQDQHPAAGSGPRPRGEPQQGGVYA